MDSQQIIAALRRKTDEIRGLCDGLGDDEMRRPPVEGEWSLLEICCHIRDTTNLSSQRITRLVEEDQPRFKRDPRRADIHSGYSQEDPRGALAAALAILQGMADQLETLNDGDWERSGIHATRGAVIVRSQAELQARHLHAHVDQMRAARAAQSA